MLSLASNPACIIMDDELNILPTSSHVKDIHPLQRNEDGTPAIPAPKAAGELKELVASLQDTMVGIRHDKLVSELPAGYVDQAPVFLSYRMPRYMDFSTTYTAMGPPPLSSPPSPAQLTTRF